MVYVKILLQAFVGVPQNKAIHCTPHAASRETPANYLSVLRRRFLAGDNNY